MYRGVVDLQTFDKIQGFLWWKCRIKCSDSMSIRIITDENYFSGIRIKFVYLNAVDYSVSTQDNSGYLHPYYESYMISMGR
jgi:hypothetical protein